jgi:hypothetical protein
MADDWAPDACTLPTADRPLRVAEFDHLFAVVLRAERRAPTLLDVLLPRGVEDSARDLARRESQCCSFFTFEFDAVGDDVVMHIGVPMSQVEVLDRLAARVAAK